MDHLFKHLAVRLWTTVVAGSVVTLVVLQPFAGTIGPDWMIIPGAGLFALVYWLTGVVFTALGRRRLTHLLKEATVWDRAGMAREAGQALARAAEVVDSYLFSPFSRKEPAGILLAKTARFEMAQGAFESISDGVIGAYLQRFPRDRVAAVKWLEEALAGRDISQRSHDIAAQIGAAHPDDLIVQRLLAQFYLAERRWDFVALQTYRHVMDAGEPLPQSLLGDLADLFLAQPRTDELALAVYLAALEIGGSPSHLLPAVAACRRTIRPSPLNAPLLRRTEAALAGIDEARRKAMAAAIMPEISDRQAQRARRSSRPAGKPLAILVRDILKRSRLALGAGADSLRGLRRYTMTDNARKAFKWGGLGVVAVAVAVLVINTALHYSANFNTTEKIPEPVVAPVTDPFTLQVAAYLKEADARKYVQQLTAQGLEAYWTRASGAGKTWYQVRIAHYQTKADARAVGEDLKKRQLIGDYYVANYKRPDIP